MAKPKDPQPLEELPTTKIPAPITPGDEPPKRPSPGRIVHYWVHGEKGTLIARPAMIIESERESAHLKGTRVSLTVFLPERAGGQMHRDNVAHSLEPTFECWTWPGKS